MGSIQKIVRFHREGGIQVVTEKKDVPALVGAQALPDVLIRTVVQTDGDVISKVDRMLIEVKEYRDALPGLWDQHFKAVKEALPESTKISKYIEKGSEVAGDLAMVAGLVEQINSGEFPDWTAIASMVGGLLFYLIKKAVPYVLKKLIQRELNKQLKAETN